MRVALTEPAASPAVRATAPGAATTGAYCGAAAAAAYSAATVCAGASLSGCARRLTISLGQPCQT